MAPRALIVWYAFPDIRNSQSNRDLIVGGMPGMKLAKYLPKFGYEPIVLSSSRFGSDDTVVHRALDAPSDRELKRIIDWVLPEEQLVSWAPHAVRRGYEIAQKLGVEVLLSSSPHVTSHIVAYFIHRAWPGIPWVADFRDGWMFEPPGRIRGLAAFSAFMERLVLRSADWVTCASDPITQDILHRHPVLAGRANTITNGFDPSDFEAIPTSSSGVVTGDDAFTLVHTGSFSRSSSRRRMEPLLDGFLQAARMLGSNRLRLLLVGELTQSEKDVANSIHPEAHVVCAGLVAPAKARAFQRQADLLIVVGGPSRSVITSKLFEYIAVGTPILFVGERCAGAQIVRSYDLGEVVAEDASKIRDAIERAYRTARQRRTDARNPLLSRAKHDFSYETIARKYAAVFDRLRQGNL